MNFELEFYEGSYEAIKKFIQECEGKHIQQISYSSYHDVLTQVCFGCKKIRTSLGEKDVRKTKLKRNGGDK